MARNIIISDDFTRDMGYSEKDFYRTLPTAIGEYQYAKKDHLVTITHRDKAHVLLINVEPAPDRVLGNIRIPRINVSFSFRDFSVAERDQFMASFDQSFQRGGG